MKHNHKACLVINVDYSPITIVSWKKAMIWHFKSNQKNFPLDIICYHDDDQIIGANYKVYKIPAVIKTQHYLKITNTKVTFSRKNLFIRDNYTCQYCGKLYKHNQLTYDHVIPKSQWKAPTSATCWTNIITACQECNKKKGNRTPQQANMKMLSIPIVPSKHYRYLPVSSELTSIDIPSAWLTYVSHLIT